MKSSEALSIIGDSKWITVLASNMQRNTASKKRRRVKSSPNQAKDSLKRQCQSRLTDFVVRANRLEGPATDIDILDTDSDTSIINLNLERNLCTDFEEEEANQTDIPDQIMDEKQQQQMQQQQQQMQQQMQQQQQQQIQQQQNSTENTLQQILTSQQALQSAMAGIQAQMNTFQTNMSHQLSSMKILESEIMNMKTRLSDLEINQQGLRSHTPLPSEPMSQLAEQVNRIERKQRENNLRLIGFGEQPRENCYEILDHILCDQMKLKTYVEVAHRSGRRGDSPRHVIFRVSSLQDKIDILKYQRQCLGSSAYFFAEDLTVKDYHTKRSLKPEIDKARAAGKQWRFRNGNLYIEGKIVQPPPQHPLPYDRPNDTQRQNMQAIPSSYAQVASPTNTPQPHQSAAVRPAFYRNTVINTPVHQGNRTVQAVVHNPLDWNPRFQPPQQQTSNFRPHSPPLQRHRYISPEQAIMPSPPLQQSQYGAQQHQPNTMHSTAFGGRPPSPNQLQCQPSTH